MKKMILVKKSLLAYFTDRGVSKGDLVEKIFNIIKKLHEKIMILFIKKYRQAKEL